eukprot:COSAG02_NODE_308_length_25072_cov_20.906925_3_plen_78_part_00
MPALRTSIAGAGDGGGGGPKHRCEHAGCSYATDHKGTFNRQELDAGGIISPMTSVVTSDARLYDAKYLLRVEWKVSD